MAEDLAARLTRDGITTPFPIQEATIPPGLAGRDIAGRAPTGSGKTLAFGLPLVERVGKGKPGRPRALILAPTRELAAQIERDLAPLAALRGRKVASFYGGVGFGNQLSALRKGVDIVVACPGRLADLIERRNVSLNDVDIVVVDEADRMADMGFLPEVRRLLDQVRPDRQTTLFSATLDGDVDVLVKRYQRDPVRHDVMAKESADLREHFFYRMERTDRLNVAVDVIVERGSTMVFCRTKRGADRLARQLHGAGLKVAAIHGDRSQSQREAALAAFSAGRVQVLVATDVAARGIHVDDVGCVLHYDPPADEKAYVHRSGRTGRAGAGGSVVSLVPPDVSAVVKDIQRRLGLPLGTTSHSSGAPRRSRPEPTPEANVTPLRPATEPSSRSKRPEHRTGGNQPGARKPAATRTAAVPPGRFDRFKRSGKRKPRG